MNTCLYLRLKKATSILFRITGTLILLGVVFWGLLGLWPDPLLEGDWNWIVRVTDRSGQTLKDFLPPNLERRENLSLDEFSPNLTAAILAAEDRRFRYHLGIDPLAMIRAAWLNIKNQKIISGGSTITMQLARLNRGLSPGPRTLSRKIKEIWWALLIERHHSKDEILTAYLNTAPCGNLTAGFQAASRFYLNKNAKYLSPAEAAFLSGLPASPGAMNPYKSPRRALARRSLILKRLADSGYLTPEETSRALEEPLTLNLSSSPYLAPHFVNRIRLQAFGQSPPPTIITTLDLDLQNKIETMAKTTVEKYRSNGLDQVAVVVMSLSNREILTWVGSSDFFDPEEGQNDGVLAFRQPGSALKPFIYTIALEQGLITPATLLNDESSEYVVQDGIYSPSNYSGGFHGLVSARIALASSLNLPAIKLTSKLRPETILNRLKLLGLDSLDQDPDFYGLGLALGGGSVNLLSMTTAYAALADGGVWRPPTLVKNQSATPPQLVFNRGAAWITSDMLSDSQARSTGFGQHGVLSTEYRSSVKTGTSKNFKDNWCLGYTENYVVGVWAGNFKNRPMEHISGVTGAGYLWRQIFDLLESNNQPHTSPRPAEVISSLYCPDSGLPAGPDCPNQILDYHLANLPEQPVCQHQLSLERFGTTIPVVGLKRTFGLLRPLTNETYAWDPGLAPEIQKIKALVQSTPDIDELIWLLNGQELRREQISGYQRDTCLIPVSRGRKTLEVVGLRNGKPIYNDTAIFIVK